MNHSFASNNQLKLLKKLLLRKYRKKERLFIAEGVRCVEQILSNEYIKVREVYADESLAGTFSFIPGNIPVYTTDSRTLADVSDTENTQGILALCEIPEEQSASEIAEQHGTIVAMDAIQDPGNAGTIIRTAGWFGATGILSGTGTVDTYHPKVVRSTAGATGALPLLSGELTDLLPIFFTAGWSVLLLDGSEHAVNIRTISQKERQLIVIGNEGNGIQKPVLDLGYPTVRIPGHSDVVESLNAAIACSIGLYELSAAGPDTKH
jgi:TrmH family RNA methyltransferase